MKTWQEIGFRREITGDHSLTLRLDQDTAEFMHHSGGALEETLYIYGLPLADLFQMLPAPRVFSLGLGMGYVEFVVGALAERSGKDFELLTMELEPHLVKAVDLFLSKELPPGEVQDDLQFVLQGLCEKLGVSAEATKARLFRARQNQTWEIRGPLGVDSVPHSTNGFHGIMYDAFSSKTSPELWTEDFLSGFFASCANENCLVSTYASTGNLKRSLTKNGFTLADRPGFQWKKQSTLGQRGVFISRPGS